MAVVYLKLKKKFLNASTQKECMEMFSINEKQLSKLVTGHHYQGGTEHLSHKRLAPEEKPQGKKAKRDIPATKGRAPDQ